MAESLLFDEPEEVGAHQMALAEFKGLAPRRQLETRNGQRWVFYDLGPRDAPPLICLHGLHGGEEVFFRQQLILNAKGYRTLSVRLPIVDDIAAFVSGCVGLDCAVSTGGARPRRTRRRFLESRERYSHTPILPCVAARLGNPTPRGRCPPPPRGLTSSSTALRPPPSRFDLFVDEVGLEEVHLWGAALGGLLLQVIRDVVCHIRSGSLHN